MTVEAHPSAAELAAFTLGTLGAEARASVEAHVAACTSCQERAAVAPGDSLIELLRCAHARMDRQPDTVSTAPVQTPAPLAPAAEAVTRPPAGAPSALAESHRPDAPDAVPPELAGHERYRVVRLLGQGGMGAVYEAEHRVMRRTVALKVIHRAYTANAAALERFRCEVRAAARLSHPNIVTTHDAEDAGDTQFLVMEYVAGISLGRLVNERGPLPVAEACAYVRQAALGLQHAHERGMVHRDVKPENLIRCADGTVKVLDFGLAALLAERGGELTEENVVMGTPDYMAPEQAEDPRSADGRADVYSLGCTLYYLLTGQAPYPAPTALLKILAHRERPLPPIGQVRPEVPAGLGRVLARMLAKKPADRYATPGEVAVALEPFTVAGASLRRPRRRPLVAAVAALLFAGLALAGVVVYRIQTDKGELVITTESADVEVVIKQGGKVVRVIDTKMDKEIRLALRSGTYELELQGPPEGLKLNIDKATLTRGETVLAKIERLAKPAAEGGAKTRAPIDDDPGAPKQLEVARRLPWPGRNDLGTWFSEDSRLCVAWGPTAFRVWEMATGKLVQESSGVLPHTVTVRFLPDGKQLLSSHADGTYRRWDLTTGKLLDQFGSGLEWPQIQGFTAQGDAFATHAGGWVQVWDLKTGQERFHVEPVRNKAILQDTAPLSPDGKRLLTVDHHGSAGRGHVRIFDVATGKELLSMPIKWNPGRGTWSADGRRVYLIAGDPELGALVIVCLDADTGELLSKVLLVPQPGTSFGQRFTRDARYLGIQYPEARLVHLYDTRTGKLAGTASGLNAWFSLSFSPNGRYAACGGEGAVIVYHMPEPPAKDKP
jgi:tRNA A-37 threonylcarbamoyl transferase component Bud32